MDLAIKRGAYSGIFVVIALIPLIIFDQMNVHGSLGVLGRVSLLLITCVVGIFGAMYSYGIVQLGNKHGNVLLSRITWLILACSVFAVLTGIIGVFHTKSQTLSEARNILLLVESTAVLFQAFAFSRLSKYYGKIALRIRDCFAIFATLILLFQLWYLSGEFRHILILLVVPIFIGVSLGLIGGYALCIRLLFQASKS